MRIPDRYKVILLKIFLQFVTVRVSMLVKIIRNPAVDKMGRPYRLYILRLASDFLSQKESDFSEWLQLHKHTRYGDAAISKATVNARIQFGDLAQIWVIVAGRKFAFKIAAKPLQIETYE